MSSPRRARASWQQLVAEAERCGSVARTAERHGVNRQRLSWWRWTLRREERETGSASLLPVVITGASAHASSVGGVEIVMGGLTMRVPLGSDASYVATLVAAIRTTC
jgi:hypothetical protein